MGLFDNDIEKDLDGALAYKVLQLLKNDSLYDGLRNEFIFISNYVTKTNDSYYFDIVNRPEFNDFVIGLDFLKTNQGTRIKVMFMDVGKFQWTKHHLTYDGCNIKTTSSGQYYKNYKLPTHLYNKQYISVIKLSDLYNGFISDKH